MSVADLLGITPKVARKRHKDDFFPTPIDGTVEALIKADNPNMAYEIWEPFCGDGKISSELRRFGYGVIETDLVDRGVGKSRIDFLMERKPLSPMIISNPPFKLAPQIVKHAIDVLNVKYMALLLKAEFPNHIYGLDMFRNGYRPARIYALSWRPDFTGGGSPPMMCSWYVWHGVHSQTSFEVLERPL